MIVMWDLVTSKVELIHMLSSEMRDNSGLWQAQSGCVRQNRISILDKAANNIDLEILVSRYVVRLSDAIVGSVNARGRVGRFEPLQSGS